MKKKKKITLEASACVICVLPLLLFVRGKSTLQVVVLLLFLLLHPFCFKLKYLKDIKIVALNITKKLFVPFQKLMYVYKAQHSMAVEGKQAEFLFSIILFCFTSLKGVFYCYFYDFNLFFACGNCMVACKASEKQLDITFSYQIISTRSCTSSTSLLCW